MKQQLLMVKICERCGQTFVRPKDFSARQWEARRFCKRACFIGARVRPHRNARSVFEQSIVPEPMSGCWLWLGTMHHDGYGQVMLNGELHRAHRLSHELHVGPIPIGLYVLHHCDNRLCVNPAHLYIGTAKDNARDAMHRGRASCQKHNF